MCKNAADGILMQCGREYGFSQDNSLRPTDITTVNIEDLKLLPCNNLKAERNLAEFDRRVSNVTKYRNFKYTSKSIRNNVILSKRNSGKVEASARIIKKLLNEREIRWNEKQKTIAEERIELRLNKASKEKDYIKKLLKDCKTWSGPFTSGEELIRTIKLRPDKENFVVKTEMAYFAYSHRSDKLQRPELYKINSISNEKKAQKFVGSLIR